MVAIFFWHQVYPQLMELMLISLLSITVVFTFVRVFFLFSPLPLRLVVLYEMYSFIHSLTQLTFFEHVHVPDIIKCWLYGNKQNRQGPCPLGGQLRNKLWTVRHVMKERRTTDLS